MFKKCCIEHDSVRIVINIFIVAKNSQKCEKTYKSKLIKKILSTLFLYFITLTYEALNITLI